MTTAPTRWIFDQVHSRKPLPTESASVKNQKTQYAYCEVLMPQYLAMLKDPTYEGFLSALACNERFTGQ